MHHFFSILKQLKASIVEASHWRTSILKVMTVLPGGHSYEEIERAIRVAGVHPVDIYECLVAHRTTFSMQRFYQALEP